MVDSLFMPDITGIHNLRVHNALAFISLPPMTGSSNPTDESPHPSGLLAYDALPNYQDFDSITSDTKFTADTRTDFYDRSLTTRGYALVGVACLSIISCSCIAAGIVMLAKRGVYAVAVSNL
ncbi:uncharacterized protein BJ212DRAFT_1574507, partial [Suillus subaureus]